MSEKPEKEFDRDELAKVESLRTCVKKSENAKGGRPSKLTPKLMEDLLGALAAGCYIETAAAYCRITKETFYEWLRKGAQDRADGVASIHAKLSDAVGQTMAEFEVKACVMLNESMKSQDAATRWMLERKFPKRWGPQAQAKVEVTGKDGGPIEQHHEHSYSPESLALASAIAGALERLTVPSDSSEGRSDGACESPPLPS